MSFNAANAMALQQGLVRALGFLRYEVDLPRGAVKVPIKVQDLGTPTPVDWAGDDPLEFKVSIVDKSDIPPAKGHLRGGEDVKLSVAADNSRLHYLPYDPSTTRGRQTVNYLLGLASMPIQVCSHVPDGKPGSDMTFEISLQNEDDTQFSERPEEIWAEVTPSTAKASGYRYVLCDPSFKSHYPPILSLKVPHWPAEADSADVKVWFKLKASAPDKAWSVKDLLSGDRAACRDWQG